ncbi:unnamed protein product [Pleuronectes platessa]|uniref:Uncharacterized protein n=1 Tax=Pleuronectes platessa TaxID=8262 RepID=A0A9N7ZDY1_PLEPL|nr:unnamed protein product [Pleuronectes platessa]
MKRQKCDWLVGVFGCSESGFVSRLVSCLGRLELRPRSLTLHEMLLSQSCAPINPIYMPVDYCSRRASCGRASAKCACTPGHRLVSLAALSGVRRRTLLNPREDFFIPAARMRRRRLEKQDTRSRRQERIMNPWRTPIGLHDPCISRSTIHQFCTASGTPNPAFSHALHHPKAAHPHSLINKQQKISSRFAVLLLAQRSADGVLRYEALGATRLTPVLTANETVDHTKHRATSTNTILSLSKHKHTTSAGEKGERVAPSCIKARAATSSSSL